MGNAGRAVARRLALLICLTSAPSGAAAQIGAEIQLYPAGLIATGRVDVSGPLDGRWSVFGGVNLTDRRDFGRHPNEQGRGPGVGLGYHRGSKRGLVYGFRVDTWFLDIDWTGSPGMPSSSRRGRTRITVIQPTGRVGYRVWTRGEQVAFTFGASAGFERNVRTVGEPVGEGAIVLLGVAVMFH